MVNSTQRAKGAVSAGQLPSDGASMTTCCAAVSAEELRERCEHATVPAVATAASFFAGLAAKRGYQRLCIEECRLLLESVSSEAQRRALLDGSTDCCIILSGQRLPNRYKDKPQLTPLPCLYLGEITPHWGRGDALRRTGTQIGANVTGTIRAQGGSTSAAPAANFLKLQGRKSLRCSQREANIYIFRPAHVCARVSREILRFFRYSL